MRPERAYGEPVVVERNGVIRRIGVRPAAVRGAVRLSSRWVWYPARTLGRLVAIGVALAVVLGVWSAMTWVSLRVLAWLGVRPW